jgi:Right handed beta helix region
VALPVILVNATGGSDTQASGAGPSTALFGTTDASTDATGLIVTLTAGTDLSGVLTDGSHVIFLNDTTAGARNFGKITATAGSGGATPTVTVSNAFGVSLTAKSWAIGGVRASVGSTTSLKMFSNNSAAGDAMPGWVVEMQSGHAETVSVAVPMRRAGDAVDGPVTLRGESGAATMPILTSSANGVLIEFRASFNQVVDVEFRNTNATKTASVAVTWITSVMGCRVRGVRVTHATNKFWRGFVGATVKMMVENCHVANCANIGIVSSTGGGLKLIGSTVRNCGSHGVTLTAGVSSLEHVITKCRIYGNAGDGINRNNGASGSDSMTITHNTIHGNAGDGIQMDQPAASATSFSAVWVESNQITSNGGFGLNLSGTSMTAEAWQAFNNRMTHNNTWNNTSGACNLSGVVENDADVDPSYTDAANGDFTIGAATRAVGYRTANWFDFSSRPYFDIGSEQHQDAGGGGGLILSRPMNGGYSG